jgi:hypothetical protein
LVEAHGREANAGIRIEREGIEQKNVHAEPEGIGSCDAVNGQTPIHEERAIVEDTHRLSGLSGVAKSRSSPTG